MPFRKVSLIPTFQDITTQLVLCKLGGLFPTAIRVESSGINVPKIIRFCYRAAPGARVPAYPVQREAFVPLSGHRDFPIVVTNMGSPYTLIPGQSTRQSFPLLAALVQQYCPL